MTVTKVSCEKKQKHSSQRARVLHPREFKIHENVRSYLSGLMGQAPIGKQHQIDIRGRC